MAGQSVKCFYLGDMMRLSVASLELTREPFHHERSELPQRFRTLPINRQVYGFIPEKVLTVA